MNTYPIIVFFSGTGGTLKALIEQQQHYRIIATVCNCPDAPGIEHTIAHRIPCHVIDHTRFAGRDAFEHEVMRCLGYYHYELIVLAGFMRRLGHQFVEQHPNQIINIHPALLPKYPGLHTYQRALAAGDKTHGTTVHFVTAEVDAGPVIAQATVDIAPDETIETLSAKTKAQEKILYPTVINQLAAANK